MEIYMIKNSEGKFLMQNSTPRIGIRFGDIEHAEFFPTETQAQGFIASCCKQNNAFAIIDCIIIKGEFIPKEGYKAIDEVLKSKRMKKLYDLMKTELTVAELLLFTASSDRIETIKHPFFQKLKAADIGEGFNKIDVTDKSNQYSGRYWREVPQANNAFNLFKKFAFIVMKDKHKEQQQ